MTRIQSFKVSRARGAKVRGIATLVKEIRGLIQSARRTAAVAVDTLQVRTSFEIGRRIVEHEQRGSLRAIYGMRVLEALAERLTAEFGRGFSRSNLQNMRSFFVLYRDRPQEIRQKPSGKLPAALSRRSIRTKSMGISSISSANTPPFALSWSHYVVLLGVRDENERKFYEIEAASNCWSQPKLKRQVSSGLYERLALSRDKKRVRELGRKGDIVARPEDMLKSPLVLEFLGLNERPAYSESDLEAAIIGKLQHFLLELGKGFLFEARQKRFTIDGDNFYVDLVFYNRLLRCYVLVDLKIDTLTHQDLGQMQMYVNYFDRYVKSANENPTIGIVLCKRKRDALVEITLPPGANIFASEYRLYLPSKEDLRQRLLEWLPEGERNVVSSK